MNATTAVLAVLLSAVSAAHAQQTPLIAWDHTWAVMHPMGAMPDIPAGGDTDFDTTWYLKQADFVANYDGPLFGANLTGVPATAGSYDSRLTKGPAGYEVATYFTAAGAEFAGFGDNDGAASAAVSGRLTTPNSGSRRAAYFRTTFTVPAGASLISPAIRYLIDDGAYIYLDGELIVAINMAATTPPNLDSYAATPEVVAAAGGNETTLTTLPLSLAAGTATGTARTIKQVGLLTPGEHTLALSVRNPTALSSSDLIMALELTATDGCTLSATSSNISRNNSGTPYNPADDTFTFDATVTGFNAGTTWTSDDPARPSGTLDVAANFGPYPVSAAPKTVTFSSQTASPCTAQLTVSPPGGTLTAAAQSWNRHPQGTLDPADDTFTAGVLVDGQFVSDSWRIVSTTPAAAAGGSPPSGQIGAVATFGPYSAASAPITVVLADAANPAITATAVIGVPSFIGSKTFAGTTSSFLSAAPLPSQWVATTALNPVITMSNAGGDIWREFRSPVFDLSSTGAVGFFMELVARDTSTNSNFEDLDAFRAKLIVTSPAGTLEINLIAPYDTDGNGMLNGSAAPYDAAADEFNLKQEAGSVAITNTLRMDAGIPADATSVQLVVEAKSIATNEFFDVRKISFSDQCGFSATAGSVVRNVNGQFANPAAHTVEFTLRAVPSGPVSPAGWNASFNRLGVPVTGASVTSGAWNTTTTIITGLPAEGGPITVIIRDKGDATCLTALNITPPIAPILVGAFSRGAVSTPVYSNGPATGWTATATGTEMTASAAIQDFTTLPVDLSGITGAVEFSMTFEAEETSNASNFEDANDTFLAELLLTSDTGASSTVSLITALDKNNDGTVKGGPATYVAADDEFNKNAEPITALLKNSWVLSHTIPDNIVSARLHVRARVEAVTEFLRLNSVRWLAPTIPGTTDSDGDGITDAQEAIAGTDPGNAASAFRVAGLTTAGNSVSAAFPTVNGKFYRGYTSTDLLTWTRDDSRAALSGTGAAEAWTFGIPAGPPARFYRIAVSGTSGGFPATLP